MMAVEKAHSLGEEVKPIKPPEDPAIRFRQGPLAFFFDTAINHFRAHHAQVRNLQKQYGVGTAPLYDRLVEEKKRLYVQDLNPLMEQVKDLELQTGGVTFYCRFLVSASKDACQEEPKEKPRRRLIRRRK
jgi:hypothetical protein